MDNMYMIILKRIRTFFYDYTDILTNIARTWKGQSCENGYFFFKHQ